MRQRLQERLEELKAEFQKGQQRMQELETETTNLRNTLLRISGAIQVLTEELENLNGQATPEEEATAAAIPETQE